MKSDQPQQTTYSFQLHFDLKKKKKTPLEAFSHLNSG